MDEIRDLIYSKLDYDKEVYDKNTYAREYRSKKLKRFGHLYDDIKVAYKGLFDNDIPYNGVDKYLYGALYEKLPEELFILISELQRNQSIRLHVFYPNIIKELCFEQNVYFLQTITFDEFQPDDLQKVMFIIPICYVMRFGLTSENNKLQVMFYCRPYTKQHHDVAHGNNFFIDELPVRELKNSQKRADTMFNYVIDMQNDIFEEHKDISNKLLEFIPCFKKMTVHGT